MADSTRRTLQGPRSRVPKGLDWLQGLKVAVFVAAAAPAVQLAWRAWHDQLGADPVHALVHGTGWWALVLLLASLAMTPLRRLSGRAEPIRFRRMLGLYAFFYASLHLGCFVVFDLQLDWALIGAELLKRPYIAVGFTAWLLLVPLAATSTRASMRRLGRRWGQLHRLVYLVAVLAVLHFWMQVKADIREPLWFAGVLALLFALRWRRPSARPAIDPAPGKT